MKKHYDERTDRWGATVAGTLLFTLASAGALYRGSFGWMDAIVGAMGIAALAVAADSFLRNAPTEVPS